MTPFRLAGLDGHSTSSGYTFDGGSYSGGGPCLNQSLTVRLRTMYGEPATVQLDTTDKRGGRTVALTPAQAREAAKALIAAADAADADMAHWREVVEGNRAKATAAAARDAELRAGILD